MEMRTFLVLLAAAALGASSAEPKKFPKPSDEERLDLVRRAHVFAPTDVASKDLFQGPPGKLRIHPMDDVTCTFFPKQMNGWTEKFSCKLENGTVVKVKYNGPSAYKEVFGEVLGTRLFWALGFYADRMIPVSVTCLQCPEHPWEYVDHRKRVPRDEKGHIEDLPRDAFPGTYHFDLAAIEEPIDAEVIEQQGRQGWDWKLLDSVDEAAGGSTKAEVDALKLLNAFVRNSDNKAAQNTLACPRDAIVEDGSGNLSCSRPIMYVDDLGSVFGEGGITTGGTARIDYEGWKAHSVWKDAKKCEARLAAIGGVFRHSTLHDPVIGEGGRRLLAAQLDKLTDEQIADLFRAGRVLRLEQKVRDGASGERPVTIDDWVALFKQKRLEITEHPGCPLP
ncbi:MAG TPA: hypothetical protein VFV19_17895 [Candidatus Polarisedimenticolaceae bacterium]|nr:hypothetical protein [Candidatus Polarisedimenticolaceae bacterium]